MQIPKNSSKTAEKQVIITGLPVIIRPAEAQLFYTDLCPNRRRPDNHPVPTIYMVIFGVSWHSRHATCHTDTGERDGIASKCLQVKERTRNSGQIKYYNTGIIIWQYYLLVTKVQDHHWPKFCESFIFLKSQVDFQTGVGLKLALGMHRLFLSNVAGSLQ